MAACCPISYVGFDQAAGLHKYYTVICGTSPLEFRFCWSVNRMTIGGCNQGVCSVPTIGCADPEPLPELAKGTDAGLKRKLYRRLVPNPANPDGRPDTPFAPEGQGMILAEYTCDYKVKSRAYWARLMTIGVADLPGAVCHIGWELDPDSPLSPLATAHFSGKWVTSVRLAPNFHIVDIKNVGRFLVHLAKEGR